MTALNPVFTVGGQIAEALEVHGVAKGAAARARAVELLDAVRIPEPARRAGIFPISSPAACASASSSRPR